MELVSKRGPEGRPGAGQRRAGLRQVWKHREFYLFMIPAMAITLIFSYIPIYGVIMAFQNVRIGQNIGQGAWVGLDNFRRLMGSSQLAVIVGNTLTINLTTMLFSIPIPIVLAILIHNCSNRMLRRTAQTATYLPHLISAVVVVSIINVFCNGEFGLINILRAAAGGDKIAFFGEPKWVVPLYLISAVWQNAGYNAVVYIAALSSIDPALVEAASIDGANNLQRIWYIDLPSLKPTIITMLLLTVGKVMSIGVDKILLMQTGLNLTASETISTYVYKTGIVNAQYGFSTAVGLFNNLCNLVILFAANMLSRRLAKTSLF